MKYLAWYLITGVVVILILMTWNRFFGKNESSLESTKPAWLKAVDNILLSLLFSAFWPIILVIRIKEMFSTKEDTVMEEEKEFAVEPAHLKEQMSIEEIEQQERVVDPLGAVPDLPFGHLHSAWQKLVDQMEAHDTIWTFEAIWTTWYKSKELMIGYAVKRGDSVGPHLLTLCKRLD